MSKFMKEQHAIDFLVFCVLGNTDDPLVACIDRAYRDMASHTLQLKNKNDENKYALRYEASKKIKKWINNLKNFSSPEEFNNDHKKICEALQEIYKGSIKSENADTITIGQAQKWVNMALKYLCVLNVLGKLKDNKLKDMLENNYKFFHIPIDRYIIKALKMPNIFWSKIEEYNNYLKYQTSKEITENKLDWENTKWIEQAKIVESDGYRKYCKSQDENI